MASQEKVTGGGRDRGRQRETRSFVLHILCTVRYAATQKHEMKCCDPRPPSAASRPYLRGRKSNIWKREPKTSYPVMYPVEPRASQHTVSSFSYTFNEITTVGLQSSPQSLRGSSIDTPTTKTKAARPIPAFRLARSPEHAPLWVALSVLLPPPPRFASGTRSVVSSPPLAKTNHVYS